MNDDHDGEKDHILATIAALDPDPYTDHMLKQRLAAPGRYYGNGGTIHSTGHVDVETDKAGNVVAVWFRCQPLPFKQTKVEKDRASEMVRMYQEHTNSGRKLVLTGVEIQD
jgi:hypothetical protein